VSLPLFRRSLCLAEQKSALFAGAGRLMKLDKRQLVIVVLLALISIALWRIASTYAVLNHTYDEPAHIAVGLQYVDRGTYPWDNTHPPMRAVYGIGPYLMGIRAFGEADTPDWARPTYFWDEGLRILYASGRYFETLTAARVAALPFFVLAVVLVFAWARSLAGPVAGLLAAMLLSTLPLALAHAGLATTDILVTATLTLALLAWAYWLASPSHSRAVLFGCAAGLAVASKFSAILFLGIVVAASGLAWLLRWRGSGAISAPQQSSARLGRGMLAVVIAAAVCLAVVWSSYRFSVGPPIRSAQGHHETIDALIGSHGLLRDLALGIAKFPLPAPEFVRGLNDLMYHNRTGHLSSFMGEVRERGWSAFFPVGILVKTPVPFLLLAAVGAVWLVRRSYREDMPLAAIPPLGALLILLGCIPSAINIGVRHVLPIFPLLAICAGVGAVLLWERTGKVRYASRGLVVILLTWQVAAGARVHPDYLAYFNECCDAAPERWLVDSDLDWGQDMHRLSLALKARGVERLRLAISGNADPAHHDLPAFEVLQPYERASGWIAVNENRLALGTRIPPYDQFRWLLEHEPVTRVGRSIRLYHIP
jgi:hypothetical protein